ncbi:hypothetical protein RB599_000815 [Gaeumannomyces hyphopodioides]
MRMHILKSLNAISRRPSRRSALPTRSPSSQSARKYNRFRGTACLVLHVSPCAISGKSNLDKCSTLLSNHPAMLSRAIRDPNPKGSSESRPPRHTLTASQTSSSRPDAASSSRPSIAEQLRGTAARPPAPAAISTAGSALSRRPINLPGRPDQTPAALSGSRRTIASLCHNTSSFDDEPDVFGLFDDEAAARKEQAKRIATTVYIADDDLSDDDALDLDFEAPSALPSVPATKSNDVISPPVASGTSVLSWSQSSDSHYQPPRRDHGGAPQPKSAKREAAVIDLEAIAPLAKKRAIPQDWGLTSKTAEEGARSAAGGRELASSSRGSSGRKDKELPWDAPMNLLKLQKKQKKAAAAGQEMTGVDILETVDEHMRATIPKNSPISLSNEQRNVKSLVCERNLSVFFTGPAGTGKSVLMRAIISDLKKKWAKDPDRLAVTASTGIAACNIGGMTLHSFSGIGLGKEDAQTLVKKIRRNAKAKNRWLRTKILIIDEISMVDGDLFDKLSQIGRTIRNNGRPWGGIQLVITGDFFQLPPVPDGADKRDIKFAFEAATWNTSIDHTIGLTEVFRQKDPEFASMLNEMRLGRISDQTVKNFKALCRPLHFEDGLEVTELPHVAGLLTWRLHAQLPVEVRGG